jgi:hypothetical protein
MLKRTQINSRENKVHVYKRFPTLDLAKRYIMKVESLDIPKLYDQILNKPLFTIYRRAIQGFAIYQADGTFKDILKFAGNWTFTPNNAENVYQLLFQMNKFFREFFSKILTGQVPLANNANLTMNADLIDLINKVGNDDDIDGDWFIIYQSTQDDALTQTAASITTGLLQNGNIFLRVGPLGHFVVLNLTDDGRRVFGTDNKFLAFDEDGDFYDYANAVGAVIDGMFDDNDTCENVFQKNIFKHNTTRREIVLETTLPMQPYLFCDHRNVQMKSELCSYKPPQEITSCKMIPGARFYEAHNRSRWLFDRHLRTHNTFILTGTELQNIHFRLMLRKYEYDTILKRYDLIMSEFPIDEAEIWTMMLSFKEV